MNTTTKKILSFVFLFAIMGLPFLTGAQFDPTTGNDTANLSQASVYDIVITVMNWLLIMITVVAVIGFIISGFMFIFAAGSGGAENAKQWLTYSIIGIIVALIGYIIVQLVANLLVGGGGDTY